MTWPAVFDGIGALFVRTDNDPVVQLDRIKPTPTWVAVKVNGSDIQTRQEIGAWITRLHASHPTVAIGVWVYCYGPPSLDVASWRLFYESAPFVIYDVEAEYKTDEGAPAEWPTLLVGSHTRETFTDGTPAAVTSYGQIPGNNTFPSSIDFGAFAQAGWPIFAQAYDGFTVIDAESYTVRRGGPYPADGVHTLTRSLRLIPGQAVYRPESIDG